jgi:hypothetical protein
MKRRFFLSAGALSILSAAYSWRSNHRHAVSTGQTIEQLLTEANSNHSNSDQRLAELKQFYREQVAPAIQGADVANQDAAQRAVNTLWDAINGYRRGIDPFCNELLWYSTRWEVLSRAPGDWWYSRDSIGPYVNSKFAKHLFTDAKLKSDIQRSVNQFYSDESANRNAMIIQVKAAISQADFPELRSIDTDAFAANISNQIKAFSKDAALSSITQMFLSELAGEAGFAAATYLISQVVTRLAAMAGISIAAAGGATMGTTVGGGGFGSMAGPLGTAAGIAAGLVAGIIIDGWMSSSYKRRIKEQINGMINVLVSEVISGSSNDSGFTPGLTGCCIALKESYSNSFESILLNQQGAV